MARSADYAIQGFLYQLHKTLLEILRSADDAVVVVEGPIEDIDVVTPRGTTAIQCKYHEAQENFTLGQIYKPVLQMMDHFHANPGAGVAYRLYAYFPGTREGARVLSEDEFRQILATDNSTLKDRYADHLRDSIDLGAFRNAFSLEFGVRYEQLVTDIAVALEDNGMPKDEIEGLIYPNAIYMVADTAIKHDGLEREVRKCELLSKLKARRTTLLNRWTVALKTYEKILSQRRRQLKPNLSQNPRDRHFLLSGALEDFEDGIVIFIKDYLGKYHHKPSHTCTPLFCLNCEPDVFDEICWRLHKNGIRVNDGCVRNKFDEQLLLREPICSFRRGALPQREFQARLVRYSEDCRLLESCKCNDLFLVTKDDRCAARAPKDVNQEHLAVRNLKELSYALGVTNDYR